MQLVVPHNGDFNAMHGVLEFDHDCVVGWMEVAAYYDPNDKEYWDKTQWQHFK